MILNTKMSVIDDPPNEKFINTNIAFFLLQVSGKVTSVTHV